MTSTALERPWELGITPMSLQDQLARLYDDDDDQTIVSDTVAKALDHADLVLYPGLGGGHFSEPGDRLSTRRLVAELEPEPRFVRYEMTPDGITGAWMYVDERTSSDVLFDVTDRLRTELGVKVGPLTDFLGLARRTYYSYRNGAIPAAKLSTLRARVDLLSALTAESPDATRTLLEQEESQVAALLERGEFRRVRELFATVRDQLDTATRLTRSAALRALAAAPEVARACILQPGFETAAEAYASVRALGDSPLDRLSAVLDASDAVQAAHRGSRLDERWEFLVAMRHAEMDEFLGEAERLAGSADFSHTAWDRFVADSAANAWQAFQPVIRPPDEVEPLDIEPDPQPEWEPNLASLGLKSYANPGS